MARFSTIGTTSLGGRGDIDRHFQTGADEGVFAHMVEQVDQRVPEILDVGEHDRFAVLVELGPGGHLHRFLERADAAGQRDERVRLLEHQHLAFVHVGRDHGVLDIAEHQFAVFEELRNDAGHMPAMLEHGAGDDAHQTQASATVDQADVTLGHVLAKLFCGCRVGRIVARTGTAVDADSFDVAHGLIWHWRPAAVKHKVSRTGGLEQVCQVT